MPSWSALPPRWRYPALALGLRLLGASGLARALAPIARGRGVVLMLHSVCPDPGAAFAPNRPLAVTPDFLARVLDLLGAEGFDFVSLDAVPERLGRDGPPFAAVTFDDGYRDNRDHAMPVLRARSVPWTVFVTTQFADGTGRLWWEELEQALARLDAVPAPEGGILPCRTLREKERAFAALHRFARAAPRPALIETLDRLCAAAGIDPRALLRARCLSWEELAALAAEPGVTVGAHAVSHHALARLGAGAACEEIAGSRRLIERRLGLPVRHLAFPFGDAGAAGPREFALAREAGFATALTTRPGPIRARDAHSPHALPRLPINGCLQDETLVRVLASGVPFLGAGPRAHPHPDRRQTWTAAPSGASRGSS